MEFWRGMDEENLNSQAFHNNAPINVKSPRVGGVGYLWEIDWEGLHLGRDFDIYVLAQGWEFDMATFLEELTPI